MSLPERRKEADQKYRQARVELKLWRERLKFRASEWIKATRKQFDLPRSFTFSLPLLDDVPSEECNVQTLTTKLTSLSSEQDLILAGEIAFRKERMVDLVHLAEIRSRVTNLEKQLMHLGDPVRDTGGYKVRIKNMSASIFRHQDRRKIIGIFILVGCVAFGLYGISFLFPRGITWGDTVVFYYEKYTPEMVLLERSPAEGVTYTLYQDLTPRSIFEGLIGHPAGSTFWVTILGCPTHNCMNYGGYTTGLYAWQELRVNITIIIIQNGDN